MTLSLGPVFFLQPHAAADLLSVTVVTVRRDVDVLGCHLAEANKRKILAG